MTIKIAIRMSYGRPMEIANANPTMNFQYQSPFILNTLSKTDAPRYYLIEEDSYAHVAASGRFVPSMQVYAHFLNYRHDY